MDFDPAKSYVLNFYGGPGMEIEWTCGYQWTQRMLSDDEDGILNEWTHSCPDPEMIVYGARVTFSLRGSS